MRKALNLVGWFAVAMVLTVAVHELAGMVVVLAIACAINAD